MKRFPFSVFPDAACGLKWNPCLSEIIVTLNFIHDSLSYFSISIVKKFPSYNKYYIQRAISNGGKVHTNGGDASLLLQTPFIC